MPKILLAKGRAKRAKHCAEFDSDRNAFIVGTRTFSFDSSIYGHGTVRDALNTAQYDKCCFCESKISHTHVSYGNVEHFRPKAGKQQIRRGKLERPGYYWLVYEWSNLFLVCDACNQQHKGNLFPLASPHRRAQSHRDDEGVEDPLLIDPQRDDPEAHITFKQEVAVSVDGSLRGETTISVLGLNREKLLDRRRDALNDLKLLAKLAIGDPVTAVMKDAQVRLAQSLHPSEQFSAMTRIALGNLQVELKRAIHDSQ